MKHLLNICNINGAQLVKDLKAMERYHLIGVREATEEQLKEYIEEVEHETD